MRTARYIAVVIVLCTAPAYAEWPKPGVIASVGLRKTWGLGEYLIFYYPEEAPPHLALSLTPTLSLSRHLAIGAHVDVANVTYHDQTQDCYELLSTDLAIALQYTDARFTVGAWVGEHRSRLTTAGPFDCVDSSAHQTRWSYPATSYGATASLDVYRSGVHHVAVVLDLQTGIGGAYFRGKQRFQLYGFNYSALTIGVGYRY